MNKLLSIIIPAYNEEKNIQPASTVISDILLKESINYEIIFVDDGSNDNTWEKITEQSSKNGNIRGISFSRNFGKESAIYAGLTFASGDCCVVIDCDLQHPPEKIVNMFHLWEEGYEVVEAVKPNRGKEHPIHTIAAKCFYNILSSTTQIEMMRA